MIRCDVMFNCAMCMSFEVVHGIGISEFGFL